MSCGGNYFAAFVFWLGFFKKNPGHLCWWNGVLYPLANDTGRRYFQGVMCVLL